jgi:hypothetical protein
MSSPGLFDSVRGGRDRRKAGRGDLRAAVTGLGTSAPYRLPPLVTVADATVTLPALRQPPDAITSTQGKVPVAPDAPAERPLTGGQRAPSIAISNDACSALAAPMLCWCQKGYCCGPVVWVRPLGVCQVV